jgi:hypothetical protein
MRQVMVRYKVKPDRVEENERLVQAVYEELGQSRPDGLQYATFKLDDGVSFVHVASTQEGENPLPQVSAFREFQKNIEDRCDEAPAVTHLTQVGSFRLFADEGR